MNKPLVTIGIPCYNVEKFIAFSIRSVLRQTYQNFELIITDDGSTDGTLDVIKQFKDDRIILIADGENHGISYRLNQQINMARGEYFIRMDGDDIMFPDRVEKEVKFLMEYPDIDVIGSHAIIIDDENQIIGYRGGTSSLPQTQDDVLKMGVFIHPTVAGKIEFFKKYHYDETLSGVEDKDLWFRGKVGGCNYTILNEPLMFYRDPLNFKLSTYLYRMKQNRKQIVSRWGLIYNKFSALRFLFASYLRSIIAIISIKLSFDDKIIKRRNKSIPKNNKYLIELLSKVSK